MSAAQKPLKVLFVDHTAERSGGEIALLRLIRNFDRTRVEPIIVFLQDGPMVSMLRSEAEVHLLPTRGEVVEGTRASLGWRAALRPASILTLVRTIASLAQLIRTLKIDVVHTNSLKSDVLGGIAARLTGRRLVWHLRDRIHPEYLSAAQVHVMSRLARVLPHAVLCVSESVRQTLLAAGRKTSGHFVNPSDSSNKSGHLNDQSFAKRVHAVHDGLEHAEMAQAQAASTPGVHGAIGLVGRISSWKGQDTFIRAAALVHPRRPDLVFRIVGGALFKDASYDQFLRALVRELKLEEVVQFTGFVTDVPRQIGQFDVLVHASTIGEPFGQVIIEGMAAGKAVIGSRGGGVPEVVLDGETGLLTTPGDEHELAAAILTLVEDAALRERLGQAGQRRVKAFFAIDKTCAGVLAVYDSLNLAGHSNSAAASGIEALSS